VQGSTSIDDAGGESYGAKSLNDASQSIALLETLIEELLAQCMSSAVCPCGTGFPLMIQPDCQEKGS
jgi:hypothetical protein